LYQNYSRQDLFQDSFALKALEFRAVRVEYIVGQISYSGTETIVRFIFELQNLRGHPDDFPWLVKNRAYFSSAQNTQLVEVFFAWTELLALAVVDTPVLVGQKRDQDKTLVVLCSCAEFLLSADPSSLKSNGSSSAHWKLVSYQATPTTMPVFLTPFTNDLIIYLPGQR